MGNDGEVDVEKQQCDGEALSPIDVQESEKSQVVSPLEAAQYLSWNTDTLKGGIHSANRTKR